jgi:tetratricopeptide (TPR) repeat protein
VNVRQTAAVSPATETHFAHRPWLLALVLAVVTFLAYFPVLRAGFFWDDDTLFARNPAMLSLPGLRQIWSSLTASRFVPLTLTSFWVERRVWGLNPLPYHALNVGVHAANAVLLWVLLRRLKIRGAWVAAAVWALHPVNTETVAWVSELKNAQSELFFLLALLTFLRFEGRLSPRDYAAALVFGAAAMLSKASTIMLPGVMLLCAWWQRGRWRRQDFLRVAPLAAFGAAMSLVTIVEQRQEIAHTGASDWALSATQRVMLAGRAPWFYAGKVLWPADLCLVYPRWELAVHSVVAWLPLVGLALVVAALWPFRHARWAQAAIFGLGYFLIALLPVLGFFDTYFFRYSLVADHFQYLGSIGLIGLVIGTGTIVCQRAGPWGRDLGVFGAAIVLLTLGVSTWKRSHVYQNLETLWSDTVTKNPQSWMVHGNLGYILSSEGRVNDAIGEFEQATRLKPDDAQAHINLGNILLQTGKVPEAIGQYQEALRLKPDDAQAHYNTGNALQRAGKVSEAIAQYEQALRVNPNYAEPHNNLGLALSESGKIQEAIRHYEQALEIDPDYAKAHNNLGLALERAGRASEAMRHYEQALRIKPDYPEALNNLAWLLATRMPPDRGNSIRAVALAERACKVSNPPMATYLDTLAAAYAAAGRFDDAIATAQKAIDVARTAGQARLVEKTEARLELYRGGRAYSQSTEVTGPGAP